MKKSLMMIVLLTLSLLLAVGCTGGLSTTTSTKTPTSIVPEALSLVITGPADEAIVNTSRITVSGKTIAEAVVSINGAIAIVDYQGIFTGEVNLDAGPNVIEVVASDFYGNEKSAMLTVIYTAALPLTVSEPVNDSVVTSQSVTVKGTTNADAVVSINGKIVSVDASGNFSEPVTLELGPNLIEVVASDFYGNTANVAITIICNP
ncbi:MAG: hypothetical protein JW856_02340 [Dehalococcoidales bacterium]|nr:hypothetical protein [Dehalococcoidales bacterium]